MDNELRGLVTKALADPFGSLSAMEKYTGRDLLVDYYCEMDIDTAVKLSQLYGLTIELTTDTTCGFKVVDKNKACGCPYDCIH